MSDLDPSIVAAVNAVMDAWSADHTVMFGSESGRRKALFSSMDRWSKAWNKPHTCMYRGCTKPSILRSHTLQRSKVLENVAEAGHVMTPTVTRDGTIAVVLIGVGRASTFPGFCSEHENLFADFEKTGRIETPQHVELQAYRTLCREISRRRFILKNMEVELERYLTAREDYFKKAILDLVPTADSITTNVSHDPREERFREGFKQLSDTLRHLERLYAATSDALEGKRSESIGKAVSVPVEIPVALSGIVLVNYKKRSEKTRTAPCAIGVVPQRGSTLIFMTTLKNHRVVLDSWMDKFRNGLLAIEMIESWMIHGTDHWFIRPSSWIALGLQRQKQVVEDLHFGNGVTSISPAAPIFDDLRKTLVGALREQLNGTEHPSLELLKRLEDEEEKLPNALR